MRLGSTAIGILGPLLIVLVATPLIAQEDSGPQLPLESLQNHSHKPVRLDLRPIITRYKTSLVRPRRVILDAQGVAYLADFASGAVLKITSETEVETLADNLNEPAGLAFDPMGNLYVSLHARGAVGEGVILKLNGMGEPTIFATGLTGPTGLAFSPDGDLYVADMEGNKISTISPEGRVSVFADNILTPSAVVFDQQGMLWVASSGQGTVYRITPQAQVSVAARSLPGPSDLAFDPEGHLIVSNYDATELMYIPEKGQPRTFAIVPKGTVGHAFDSEGNLFLVNWDYQSLMKITLNLTIPCPHCGKPIPLQLRPEPKAKPPQDPVL